MSERSSWSPCSATRSPLRPDLNPTTEPAGGRRAAAAGRSLRWTSPPTQPRTQLGSPSAERRLRAELYRVAVRTHRPEPARRWPVAFDRVGWRRLAKPAPCHPAAAPQRGLSARSAPARPRGRHSRSTPGPAEDGQGVVAAVAGPESVVHLRWHSGRPKSFISRNCGRCRASPAPPARSLVPLI